jgi:hypothetical protein
MIKNLDQNLIDHLNNNKVFLKIDHRDVSIYPYVPDAAPKDKYPAIHIDSPKIVDEEQYLSDFSFVYIDVPIWISDKQDALGAGPKTADIRIADLVKKITSVLKDYNYGCYSKITYNFGETEDVDNNIKNTILTIKIKALQGD